MNPINPKSEIRNPKSPDGTALITLDPSLKPYSQKLHDRFAHYQQLRDQIDAKGGLMGEISQGHQYFGFNRGVNGAKTGVWYREWAPGATNLALIGDFNNWDRETHPLKRDEWGTWSIFLPDSEYQHRLTHGSKVKVHVRSAVGGIDRIPAYIRRVVQDEGSGGFAGEYWAPDAPYEWQHYPPKLSIGGRAAKRIETPSHRTQYGGLRIYEAHVGIAQEARKVGTFVEFTQNVLPRIADLGYNAVQLMAVMEHPYYASFGYHVSNFFAVSSRFGTPKELKALIDTAHGMGLLVIMDLVHSHVVKNIHEGLNLFDGTEYQYFHAGKRGEHLAWDSLCFNYGKSEVQRFLLSNIRFWLEEYRFDGFRFDGVTSMLYLDHGLGKAFTGYDDYFNDNVDRDALAYLMLANELVHAVQSDAITIAEDVSGMPGLARPVEEGGLGFDYRLAMGIPDYWIKLLKEKKDEQWNLDALYHTLLNRREHEKHIAYAESHDQALVGDKTIAFWLMDQQMYWNMSVFTHHLTVARGIALHKMIRLITFSLGGEGYLNFMGNEFGHPEWIDFPRAGNDYSYQHARRQWHLVDRDDLRYKGLNNFDRAMLQLDTRYNLLSDRFIQRLMLSEENKQLVYRRGPLVFVFNFHPTQSYQALRIPVPDPDDYRLILNTDAVRFSGHGLVTEEMIYPKQDISINGSNQSIQLYLPARSAQVLAPSGYA